MEGKTSFLEYKDTFQVNHKDGNTKNNHANNLEWVTSKENMRHAYLVELNKKVRAVLQYELNKDSTCGNFIQEFPSIAEASRKSNVPEHEIRSVCKNEFKPRQFVWKFKDESLTAEWSKKFCAKVKLGESSEAQAPKKPAKEVFVYHKKNKTERGDLLGVYKSYGEAGRACNVNEETIRRSCAEKAPTRTKFIFEVKM